MFEIYTDGSASDSHSGWGFVVVKDFVKLHEEKGCGNLGDTNQKMELVAAIKACEWAEKNIKDQEAMRLYSDSAYLVNCYKDGWYLNWESNGWVNSKKQPVANRSEWESLIDYFRTPNFSFEKIKGHSGHIYNERANDLAQNKVEPSYLTNNKKNDRIYVEISDIFLNYSLKRISIKNAVSAVIKIINRETKTNE